MKQLDQLAELYDSYDIFFCDVWGVVHNGIVAYPSAIAALEQARQAGKYVFFVTNSPRLRGGVVAQFEMLGGRPSCYDGIVTSGDVTRDLIKEVPCRIFHIGIERDYSLFEGLDVELVKKFEASVIVCTGLFDDENETPDDYLPLLESLCARNLPFICANPDIVVQRGDRVFWCAGSLARVYTQLGGRTLISGKPHRPIYDAVYKMAEKIAGKSLDKSRILAIGDGILTDVKGAELYDLDVLFIGGGIHKHNYMEEGKINRKKLDTFLKKFGMKPVSFMMELG
ncbi:MAG: subfamily IIA [Candidatus Tokpelaia sp. JSC189]|nr:MAG: subfamily IIA [Candidatus Tokpelaia sp. JSC189]